MILVRSWRCDCQLLPGFVINWWQNQVTRQPHMMTSSNGNIFRMTGPLCGEFTMDKGPWCGALMFSLICAWTSVWVKTRDAGDLRHYHAHYDVTLMIPPWPNRIWKCFPHHMMTSWNGNIFRDTGHLCGEFTGPPVTPHKGQWRAALMFSLICVWINGWVNNREAGDLRRHCAHYDVIVMQIYWYCGGIHWSLVTAPSHYLN